MTDEPGTASDRGIRRLSLDGRSFFCRDGLLEVWLAMLVDAMDPSADLSEPWRASLAAEWRSQATVRFDGVMTSELDPYLVTAPRRRAITALCRQVRDDLARGRLAPGPLTRRVIEAFGQPITSSSSASREGLLRVADSMIWLLDGAR